MRNLLERIRKLPLQTHKAISFLSILGGAALGWICSQFSPYLDLTMILCFAVVIGGFVWHIIFVRCPHCGRCFNLRESVSSFCPDCGEKLE